MRSDWPPSDIETLTRMADAGYCDREIAYVLQRSRRAVCDKRNELIVKPGQPHVWQAMIARMKYRLDIQSASKALP